MTTINKNQIKNNLSRYVDRFGSQNKASRSLKGVSLATVSNILAGKWESIDDKMWLSIESQVRFSTDGWTAVETRDFKLFSQFLNDAQAYSNVFAVIGQAGSGKSFTAKYYSENNKNAFLLQCNEYWNRKYFLGELLQKMGRDASGTVADMMDEVVRALKSVQQPLIILDEADKLSDIVLQFFITLYNQLEGHCGIVLCATDHLAKRIRKGLKLNKRGYKEIYSRIGRKFIELNGVGSTDIAQVCNANGINDNQRIREIFKDSELDLRRVKRKIHALKISVEQSKTAA